MAPADVMDQAASEIGKAYNEPMSLEQFLTDEVDDHPYGVAQAPLYLLSAIEHYGTKTVIEQGEEKERYRFFDDPANDGKHAVLGNTEVLNGLVDDLKNIAADRSKGEKMLWVAGPTATGKSELKRCMINMLEAYSRNHEPRYTIEWNTHGGSNTADMGFQQPDDAADDDSGGAVDAEGWYNSPVQTNPLLVLPEAAREEAVDQLNEILEDRIDIDVRGDLDPFSQEAYDELLDRYRRESDVDDDEVFRKATAGNHLRVKDYIVEEGRGIGVLYADTSGSPSEKLVGSWIPELIKRQDLNSYGKRDARAFGYNGLLSQANGGIAIIEDASEHPKTLMKLLNIPEEDAITMDKGHRMDIDSVLMLISNYDLEAQLNKRSEQGVFDKQRSLRRRLDKRELGYLTSYTREAELIRREMTSKLERWDTVNDEEADDAVTEPMDMDVKIDDEVVERKVAPHGIEAAALYSIASRISPSIDLNGDASVASKIKDDDFGLFDKIELYDTGYLLREGVEIEKGDFVLEDSDDDGKRNGIPVTVTRDAIAGLMTAENDRSHDEYNVGSVIMPEDVIEAIHDQIGEEELFDDDEEKPHYRELRDDIEAYVFNRQEQDVLEALLADVVVDDDEIERYMDHVEGYVTDDTVKTRSGYEEPNEVFMKQFETDILGRFDAGQYDGDESDDKAIDSFRQTIFTELGKIHREVDGPVTAAHIRELPALSDVLAEQEWEDVEEQYDNWDYGQWDDPPTGTPLDREKSSMKDIKHQLLKRLEERGYSAASAFLTADKVVKERRSTVRTRKQAKKIGDDNGD